MKKPLKVFITYSHKDAAKRKRLETFLAVMINNGEIKIWSDAEILAGDKWEKEIAENLKESDILLYLVSADSLASKNCNKELTTIVEASNIPVISIILDDCDFEFHSVAKFEILPTKNKGFAPISSSCWKNHSQAWQNVVDGIRKKIASIPCKSTQGGSGIHPSASIKILPAPPIPEQAMAELVSRANFFLMLGNNDLAIANFSKAIVLNPDYVLAYNNRGVAYNHEGHHDIAKGNHDIAKSNYDLAIEEFNKAIELDPSYVEAYVNRGNSYRRKGEYDNAIVDYNKAIKLKPNFAAIYNNRGNVHYDKKDYELAIVDYTKAIERDSNFAEAYGNRGGTKAKKHDYKGALEDFKIALQLAEQQGNKKIVADAQSAIADLAEPK